VLISIFMGSLAVLSLAAMCLPRLRRRRLAASYAELLEECLDRQPHHERDHSEKHETATPFTRSLRAAAIANRFSRKIHEAGLPMLSPEERIKRAKEAMCRSRT